VFAKDCKGHTALHFACCYGQARCAELLVGFRADVEARSDEGVTPLMLAASSSADGAGLIAVIRCLVSHGAQLDAMATCKGVGLGSGGALHRACSTGSAEVCDELLALGAQVEVADEDGWTPLHFAARFNHSLIISLLVNKGANVNVQDVDGWTPLHNSCRNGRNKCVAVLLANDANILLPTKVGETPLHISCRKGKVKVTGTLLEHVGGNEPLLIALLSQRDKYNRTAYDVASMPTLRDMLKESANKCGSRVAFGADGTQGGGGGSRSRSLSLSGFASSLSSMISHSFRKKSVSRS